MVTSLAKGLRLIPLSTSENSLKLLLKTQKVHARLVKCGDLNQLPWLYLNCGAFSVARKLFDEITNWDLVSATSIIGAFSRCNHHHDAISMFSHLLSTDVRPNEFTFSTVIHSGSAMCDISTGKQLHACAMKMGFNSNLFVGSSLLNQYAKLGSIQDAEGAFQDIHEPNVVTHTTLINAYLKNRMFCDACYLFESMPERNVVSWNCMIAGCSQHGLNEESVKFFVEMGRQRVPPNKETFPPVFTAAANITALNMGKSFHGLAIKYVGDKEVDVYVANSLINFYAKCGNLEDGMLAFDSIKSRNTVSWSSVICGYACNGKAKEALELYKKARDLDIKPNDSMLHGLLFACNHAGLTDDGYRIFRSVKEEQPEIVKSEHYVSLINLFARAGRFDDAMRVLEEEFHFEPGVGIWKALTGGHQINLNKEMAQFIAKRIKESDPKDSSSYVLMSNMYCSIGQWDDASQIRRDIREKGMKRVTGSSWIEIKNEIHVFSNGYCTHPQSEEIYLILEYINKDLVQSSFKLMDIVHILE
ncbi:Pentatricopeptide repeat superfamily protein [Rhynchospora pubera]|uniref:Pentatricopeptide repeat superfamily protein n=1 Tax=Rhynchospora pubera TaxID=906938 RepID=A0AAV8FYC0_9POAL|nr:Pentatricopeptide repeat superfamily protein [Rhynchospora pubera]